MNLSEQRQAEYEAMGLPWKWLPLPSPNSGENDRLIEYSLEAINAFHANQQQIEDLKKQVEQLLKDLIDLQ